MIVKTEIPQTAKVWIYQSPTAFTDAQVAAIKTELEAFIAQWASHGTALNGYYEIIENQFILIAVDETEQYATGCSIDKSVSVIKKIESLTGLNLTDKALVGYRHNNQIKTTDFRAIKNLIESGEITPETPIFNLTVTTYNQISTNLETPAKDSWVKRYFN